MHRNRSRSSPWPLWLVVAVLFWVSPIRAADLEGPEAEAPAVGGTDVQAPDAGAAAIEGVWARPNGRTKIRIEPCGEALCGVIVWIADTGRNDVKNPDPDRRARPIVGSKMLSDLKPSARPGEWDGALYDAENGKTYRGSVVLVAGKLDLKGCQSVFCKEAEWTRVSE